MTPRERREELKQLKIIANNYLEFYKPLVLVNNIQWRQDRNLLNMVELKKIIKLINKNLKDDKVDNYCEIVNKYMLASENNEDYDDFSKPFWVLKMQFDQQTSRNDACGHNLLRRLARLAPDHSIFLDIAWLNLPSEEELIEIALGITDPEVLGRYLPEALDDSVMSFIKLEQLNKTDEGDKEILAMAHGCSTNSKYIISNILLVSLIEGLTKKLLKYIYQKQNPHLTDEQVFNYIYVEFTSLENLIKRGNWSQDYPIEIGESVAYYYDSTESELDELRERYENDTIAANNSIDILIRTATGIYSTIDRIRSGQLVDIPQENFLDDLVEVRRQKEQLRNNQFDKISVKVLLGFLNRKYKEDRNQIIHGNYALFNKSWHNFYYAKTLGKVLSVFCNYIDLYEREG